MAELESRGDVEAFLWDICQLFDGDGWQRHNLSKRNNKIRHIRIFLEREFDEEIYGKQCNADLWDRGTCNRKVPIDKRHCSDHQWKLSNYDP